MKFQRNLWEILIPAYSPEKKKYPLSYHQKWDAQIRKISGGLTILNTANGQWITAKGKLLIEKMIPVRILCTKREIQKIITLTLAHYQQEAVLAYKISDEVVLRRRL